MLIASFSCCKVIALRLLFSFSKSIAISLANWGLDVVNNLTALEASPNLPAALILGINQ